MYRLYNHRALGFSVTPCMSCRDAAQIPWGDAGADVICESTGVYTTIDKVIDAEIYVQRFRPHSLSIFNDWTARDGKYAVTISYSASGVSSHEGRSQEGCYLSPIPRR